MQMSHKVYPDLFQAYVRDGYTWFPFEVDRQGAVPSPEQTQTLLNSEFQHKYDYLLHALPNARELQGIDKLQEKEPIDDLIDLKAFIDDEDMCDFFYVDPLFNDIVVVTKADFISPEGIAKWRQRNAMAATTASSTTAPALVASATTAPATTAPATTAYVAPVAPGPAPATAAPVATDVTMEVEYIDVDSADGAVEHRNNDEPAATLITTTVPSSALLMPVSALASAIDATRVIEDTYPTTIDSAIYDKICYALVLADQRVLKSSSAVTYEALPMNRSLLATEYKPIDLPQNYSRRDTLKFDSGPSQIEESVQRSTPKKKRGGTPKGKRSKVSAQTVSDDLIVLDDSVDDEPTSPRNTTPKRSRHAGTAMESEDQPEAAELQVRLLLHQQEMSKLSALNTSVERSILALSPDESAFMQEPDSSEESMNVRMFGLQFRCKESEAIDYFNLLHPIKFIVWSNVNVQILLQGADETIEEIVSSKQTNEEKKTKTRFWFRYVKERLAEILPATGIAYDTPLAHCIRWKYYKQAEDIPHTNKNACKVIYDYVLDHFIQKYVQAQPPELIESYQAIFLPPTMKCFFQAEIQRKGSISRPGLGLRPIEEFCEILTYAILYDTRACPNCTTADGDKLLRSIPANADINYVYTFIRKFIVKELGKWYEEMVLAKDPMDWINICVRLNSALWHYKENERLRPKRQ